MTRFSLGYDESHWKFHFFTLYYVCSIVKVRTRTYFAALLIFLWYSFVHLQNCSGCRLVEFWSALFCSSCSLLALLPLLLWIYSLSYISCICSIGLVCAFSEFICPNFAVLSSFLALLFRPSVTYVVHFCWYIFIFINFCYYILAVSYLYFFFIKYPYIFCSPYCIIAASRYQCCQLWFAENCSLFKFCYATVWYNSVQL